MFNSLNTLRSLSVEPRTDVTSESDVFVVQRIIIIIRIIHRIDAAHRRRDARRDRVCGDANDVDRVVAREADAAGG